MAAPSLLSVWNDIDPKRLDEYERWHTLEHVPERVSVPGFIAGKRYVKLDGNGARYLTLYDVESLEVLCTPRYQELIDQPSNWSRSMRSSFRNFARRMFNEGISLGVGVGGGLGILLMRTSAPASADRFEAAVRQFHATAWKHSVHRVRWLQVVQGVLHPMESDSQLSPGDAQFLGLVEGSECEAIMGATAELQQTVLQSVPRVLTDGMAHYQFVYQVLHSELCDVSRRPAGQDERMRQYPA